MFKCHLRQIVSLFVSICSFFSALCSRFVLRSAVSLIEFHWFYYRLLEIVLSQLIAYCSSNMKEKNASTSWKFKIELRIQDGGRTKIEELWSLRAKSWLWHIVVDHFIFMAWTHNYSHSINENDPIKKQNPYHFMAILEFMLLTGFFGWL